MATASNRKGLLRLISAASPRRLVILLPLLVSLLLLSTFGLFAWLTIQRQEQLVIHGAHQRLHALAKTVATIAGSVIDPASLEQALLQSADYPGVARIRISDARGQVLAVVVRERRLQSHFKYRARNLAPPSTNKPQFIKQTDHIRYWYPIKIGGAPAWTVIDYRIADAALMKSVFWQNSIIVAVTAILAGIALLYLSLKGPMLAIRRVAAFARNLDRFQGGTIDTERSIIEIRELEEALNQASSSLRNATKRLNDQKFALDQSSIVSIADNNGQIIYVNDRFCTASGYQHNELLGFNQYFLSSDYYTESFFNNLRETVGRGLVWRGELQNSTKDGGTFWVRTTIVPFLDENGLPYQFVSIMNDITAQKHAETQMRKLSRVLEKTADAVFITDTSGVIEYVNPAFVEITGYGRDEAIGKKPELIKSGRMDAGFYQRMWSEISQGRVFQDVFINRRKNGELYYEEKTITPLKDEYGNTTHYISTGKEITERIQIQERLRYLVQYDILTDLPNRTLFIDRLNQALARTHWNKRYVAVLFLDIDRFKVINDTLGHDAGDNLLRHIGKQLSGCVREGDTIARFGDDEFAIILEDVALPADVPGIANKIINCFTEPFYINSHELFVTASIGISVSPGDAGNANDMLRNADTAMYQAKEEGRNNYQFYSTGMDVNALERLNMETSLRRALERDEFVLFYQPQVNVRTGRIFGVEALIRWRHPDLGLILPERFIPLLEENGLIIPVGRWVLRNACMQKSLWQRSGLDTNRLSINMSVRQFNDPDLASVIDQTLRETDIDPSLLELEITESIFMHHTHTIKTNLQNIRDLGVRLAIDDFGTGYSSLSYLRRYPVDCIKIDQSFIRDITSDPDDAEIVKAILAMAQSLKLDVIAEGVETRDQLRLLRAWKCQSMQGFLLNPPLLNDDIEALLSYLQDNPKARRWPA